MKFPVTAIIEIHKDGKWIPAAELRALDVNKVQFSYLDEYIFNGNAIPVSLGMPVAHHVPAHIEGIFGPEVDRRPPAFLYDLVPQGRGRKFLLDILKLADSDEMIAPLVMTGAFNPIGCLRLNTALDFYQEQSLQNPDPGMKDGFSLADIIGKREEFLEHISLHSMLASGTTGVQGVAPKFLLTTNKDGQWFADMAIEDDHANEHWLVKLARGKSEDDRSVLRNEAAYLRVADKVGLRTHADPMLHGEMLFVRRFDRVATETGLHRLHQESVASLIGQRGFGASHPQQSLLQAIRQHVTDPLGETIEFMKRDVLNLALRNTDNHARNSAVQRTLDGRIQLTPLFDFAPMYKDPEVVPRSCHWRASDKSRQDSWIQVIESLDVPDSERALIAQAMGDFASVAGRLEDIACDCGVEKDILDACRRTIEDQTRQLDAVHTQLVDKIKFDTPRHG